MECRSTLNGAPLDLKERLDADGLVDVLGDGAPLGGGPAPEKG